MWIRRRRSSSFLSSLVALAMTGLAGNALLKLIEEPPPGAHLILTAASREGLMPTIRSRVQAIRLAELDVDSVREVLIRRGMPRDQAETLATQSDGSHRHLELLAGGSVPVEALLTLCAGQHSPATVQACIESLPDKPTKAQRDAGMTEAGLQRAVLHRWLGVTRTVLRRSLRSGDASAIIAFDRLAGAERDLRLNLNVRIVLEGLALSSPHSHHFR